MGGVVVNRWTDKSGGHSAGRVGGEQRREVTWTDKLPVPVTLGAGYQRAGPQPAGSFQGGEEGGGGLILLVKFPRKRK